MNANDKMRILKREKLKSRQDITILEYMKEHDLQYADVKQQIEDKVCKLSKACRDRVLEYWDKDGNFIGSVDDKATEEITEIEKESETKVVVGQ